MKTKYKAFHSADQVEEWVAQFNSFFRQIMILIKYF